MIWYIKHDNVVSTMSIRIQLYVNTNVYNNSIVFDKICENGIECQCTGGSSTSSAHMAHGYFISTFIYYVQSVNHGKISNINY